MSSLLHSTLYRVVEGVRYKPGWQVSLRTMHDHPHLWVTATVPDSNPPHSIITIEHIRPAPFAFTSPQSYVYENEGFVREWVKHCLSEVEGHELGEWLRFGDERPYAPPHGDEGDPYQQRLHL